MRFTCARWWAFLLWLAMASAEAWAAFPNVSGFAPAAGGPGQGVRIFGSGFTGASSVTFGPQGAEAVFNVVHDGEIFATVPANGITGSISVTAGFTASSPGTFYVAPRVTGFLPASAAVGNQIRVDGENFSPGTVTVTFNGGVNGAGVAVTSAQQLFVNVPVGAKTGPLTVTVSIASTNLTGSGNTNFIVTGTGPVITGFSPGSGPPGTQVLIEGGDFTQASGVKFNGTNASFNVTAATQIYATVPPNATSGPISVTTPAGTATSSSSFFVSGAPVVTGFSPAGGPVGSTVVIEGQRFMGATNVLFNNVGTANFSVTADSQIHATVPSGATAGRIKVQNPFGEGVSGTDFVVGSAPSINSFNPVGGPAGTQVTVKGANFTTAANMKVRFNGSNATFTVTAVGVELVATVPANAGTGPISVETLFGTNTTSSNFLFGSAPIITGFSPAGGQTNTPVIITGDNFFAGFTTVKFNGLISSNAAVTAENQIDAPVPFGATTGPITIETPLGTNTTSSNFFVTPRIDGFSPTNGGAGASVTITGLNFIGASSVRFNSVEAGFLVLSNSAIRAHVPTNATTGPISVVTPAGIVSAPTNFAIAPMIFGFTPAQAPAGSSITITGSAFATPLSVTFFNNQPAASVTPVSVTEVRATVPANASSGPIRVTTPDGAAVSPADFIVQPAITSFTPTNGGFGTVVTIDGTTLGNVINAQFNGINASSVEVISATRVRATVPAGATTGPITVFTPDASGTSAQLFHVTPAILGFSPASATPGATIRIDGIGLDTVTSVEFNGAAAAQFTTASSNRLDVVVPMAATTGPIRINSPANSSQTSSNFTVLPVITGFSPDNGGFVEEVVLTGGGFTGVTNVLFNNEPAVFSVLASTAIRAFVPAAATTGPLRVQAAAGSAVSPDTFTVVPPTIAGFDPPTATVGSPVTINGRSFGGVTNVTFNGIPAAFVTNTPFTQITATAPASASYGPIRVFTPAGTAVSADNFGVRPVVTGIAPLNGPIGSFVTITGNGFSGATNVQFSGVNSASFNVDHAGQITAQVPPVASKGPVRVQSPGGFADSAEEFQPLLPGVTGFAPASGGAGTVVTITGTNLSAITNVQFFDGASATFTVDSATQIRATVPLSAATGPVTIRGPGTLFQTSTNFTVLPVITGFSPLEGNAGLSVTITGTLFTGATRVEFGGGGTTNFTVNSASQVIATVPQTATTGPIRVVTPGGAAVSEDHFTVFPELTFFTPNNGPVGTLVHLRGVNLAGTTAVQFNSINAAFTNESSTNIVAAVPVGATTGTIRIVTPQGNLDSATPFRVTPRIDAFSPKGGLPGDSVLLLGSAFTGATNVLFTTNVAAASFVVSNYSMISAVVPAGAASGPVIVRTPSGEGASAFDFLVGAVLFTAPTNASQLAIAWSTNAAGYALEYTTDLTPPIRWQPVTNTPSVINGRNTVVIDHTDPPRYFRLRQ